MKHTLFLKGCGTMFLFQLFFITPALSQDITVHGHVKDIFNRTMIGASVKIKGTTTEVFTDSLGNYLITAPVKGKLVFSIKGFVTQKIAVKGNTTMDVTLTLDLDKSNNSEEDTGFGIVKKSETSLASTSVNKKLLNQNKEVDIAQLLQTVPGIKIVYVGSEIKLLIRGIRSMNGDNYALIVLNGSTYYGSLNDLDRNAIESIQVLKDAVSITGYGSRGANGIVLISTKVQK
jgi:TonB-dependent SusC/RagA subfamily outer membrane receptor